MYPKPYSIFLKRTISLENIFVTTGAWNITIWERDYEGHVCSRQDEYPDPLKDPTNRAP